MINARNRHDERAIAFFGTWMVFGLFLDGWAHNTEKPETFFSPWHFILYSGFGAAVVYFIFRERILKKRSSPDRLMTVGLVAFIVGAVGDGIWHEIFGIEVDLEALLSPTHLALMIGGLLMLGAGFRAASADPDQHRADFATIVTMTLSAAVVMFFTQYLNALRFGGLFTGAGDEVWQVQAVGAVFVTNAVMLTMTFLIVRRFGAPRWAFMLSYGALALALVGLNGRSGALLTIPAMAIAGAITDLLVARLRPSGTNVRGARIFSALVPLVIWGSWFASIHVMSGVRWAAELWTGTIVLVVLEGIALGLLAFPTKTPERTMGLEPATPTLATRLPQVNSD